MSPPHCLPPALRRPPDCPHHPGAQAANPATCLRLSFSNPGGSTYSKHGFHFYRQASPGNSSAHNQRPCLSNPLPPRHRGSILAKLGFPPTALQIPKSQHTPKPKTMLSRCAANDLPAWQPAAFVLSMVFSLWAHQLLGLRTMDPQTPCLEHLPLRWP